MPTSEIAERAETALRERRGTTLKALEIARLIAPGYSQRADGRNFENRIYSVLKRKPEIFSLWSRGRWTLSEFVKQEEFDFGADGPGEGK